MPKLVKKLTHNFTVINNRIFQDRKLKAIDRGILGTMLSLSDNWNFSIKGLAAILPDGETAIANSLRRLEKAHYLIRRRIYKDGKIIDWDYIISDEPMEADDNDDNSNDSNGNSFTKKAEQTDTAETVESLDGFETVEPVETVESSHLFLPDLDVEKLDVEKLDGEKLDAENQDVENRSNYKETNNKKQKNKESCYKVSIYQSAKNQSFQQETSSDKKIDEIDRKISRKEKKAEIEMLVKRNIEYDWYADFFDEYPDNFYDRGKETYASNMAEIDMIVELIVNTICSKQKHIRISGSDMFHDVVESRFLKLEMRHIEYALKSMMLNTKEVRNPIAYLTTVLYNAVTTCDFAENNALKNMDPALFIPEQFHNTEFRDKYYSQSAFVPIRHDMREGVCS